MIADADGIDAVSMRRVAAELGAGTMTLYSYVRTKADLLDLMSDAIMGEVLVPEGELSSNWREALAAVARRSCEAFIRHPWALDGLRGARGGPNSMRHFEQTLAAVASLDLDLAGKLDLVSIVDDYVFGYALRAAELARESGTFEELRDHVLPYFAALMASGDYPELEKLFGGVDPERGFATVWAAFTAEGRFERGLQRMLDGFAASLGHP